MFRIFFIIFFIISCTSKKNDFHSLVVMVGGSSKFNHDNRDFSRFFLKSKNSLSHLHHIIDLSQIGVLNASVISSQIKNKINNKTKQVIFLIHAHGKKKERNQLTHSIEIKNGIFSLDKLSNLITWLDSKKINVAVIDHSCYSGNSLRNY